jgi:SAM-dependent methyltransferase
MVSVKRWEQAQETEPSFWEGVAQNEVALLDTLSSNAAKASQLRRLLPARPVTCLEVGIGPLGLGVIGFLPEIPFRAGLDPLSPVWGRCADGLWAFVNSRRVPYVISLGESIAIRSCAVDLVVCCNVLDHVLNPEAVLTEIRRVLKPDGHLFLDVHTFSLLGLLKWHAWTKRRHSDEILVKSHPYRFLEQTVQAMLRAQGLEILAKEGHSLLSVLCGHARATAFLATKR